MDDFSTKNDQVGPLGFSKGAPGDLFLTPPRGHQNPMFGLPTAVAVIGSPNPTTSSYFLLLPLTAYSYSYLLLPTTTGSYLLLPTTTTVRPSLDESGPRPLVHRINIASVYN